jgi:exodeoxyribonuclease VII large subunit
MENLFSQDKLYTVTELNETVRNLIRREFSGMVWVCGEIQDLRERGHINLNLVQKHAQSDEIIAQVKAVIFENIKPRILHRLSDVAAGFELKKDIEVKFLCRVDLYVKTGQFSLTVMDIDPVYTLGKVAQSRLKIIQELTAQGLLEKNKAIKLSLLPLKLGLITSQDSAAYHDFINELSLSGYGFKVLVYDCAVQGRQMEQDIIKAMDYFDQLAAEELDAIIITRGGGSTADLSWFDNKNIAQRIAYAKTAVITALGHQINITIADLVSHTSVKTPTKAAQFFVEAITNFQKKIDFLQENIFNRAIERTGNQNKVLENSALRIEGQISRYFRGYQEKIIADKHKISAAAGILVEHNRQFLDRTAQQIIFSFDKFLQSKNLFLNHSQEKIKLLDPRQILKRGYSITFKNSKVIKSVAELAKNDIIETMLYNGQVQSRIT